VRGDRDLLVVGIARDSHWRDVTGDPEPFLYLPLGRYEQPTGATIIVRSALTLDETTAAVREDAATLDRAVPVSIGLPMAASLDREMASQRLFSAMLLWVGGIALALSAIGLYGLVSQAANDRAREFGIRLALGATRGDIGRLVLRHIVFVGASGTVAGLGLAWIASRSLESMLFGVSAVDPFTYATAAACLAVVVVAATLAPARRATRVQPAQILRAE
jgi:putative ABC transport system permease protein